MIRSSFEEEIPLPWTETPVWTERIFQNRAINGLPRFYKSDIWHNTQMGLCKDFAASSITLLVQLLPGSNIDLRFQYLSAMHCTWCSKSKKTKYVSKLDKHTFGGCGKRDEPTASWNKAALTVTMLQFIEFLCGQYQKECDQDQRLRFIASAVKSGNYFMSQLYANDLWIPSAQAREISRAGKHFVSAYVYLAYLSSEVGEPKFPLKPKLHMVHEAAVALEIQSEESDFAYNPLAESCSIDEDFVGRVAFLTRHVSPRQMALRSIERYLVQINLSWSWLDLK